MVSQKDSDMSEQEEKQQEDFGSMDVDTADALAGEETKTDPPPPEHHGFLEQFEILAYKSLEDLKEVVILGLEGAERITLIKVGLKLLTLSMHGVKEEDFTPEMIHEVEELLAEIPIFPTSNS